ncbi:hypothetical protein RJ640_007655 [Escallonia rubra]|uniref:DNA/RNA-binding protein Alba-like domain-containing protein n=1 Tax=Escallonia rubra TaxID=112253 RepID=A0AA88R2P1_9ASTE|nr:hypothetical protein RJ640_007655 [Escallonia rubra]
MGTEVTVGGAMLIGVELILFVGFPAPSDHTHIAPGIQTRRMRYYGQEKQAKEIVLKAMGQAISKTVAITEILKKRIPGLSQDTSISSTSIVDVWEPIEEGLVPVELTRQVSLITVTLSTTELNQNSPGYQAPSHVEEQNPGNQHQQPHQQQQQRQQRLQQPRQAYLPSAETSASSSYSLQKMVDTMIGVEEVGEAEVGVIVVLVMKEEEPEVMKEAEEEVMKEAEEEVMKEVRAMKQAEEEVMKEAEEEVMKEVRAMKQLRAEVMKEVEAEIMEQVLAMKEVEAEAMKGVGAEATKVEAAEAMKVEEAEAMKGVEAEVMDVAGGGWEVGEGVVDTGKSIRWSVCSILGDATGL